MSAQATEVQRALSRAAFGQTYRLEVMLAVARASDGLVNLTDLAQAIAQPPSNIQGALKSLVAVGLLSEIPSGDSKRKFYMRNPSAAWTWAEEMASIAAAQTNPSTPTVAIDG